MNYYLVLVLALTGVAQASDDCSVAVGEEQVAETVTISTDVPAHLKGATIIVRRKDGKESAVPAELFKVVPRKQQRIVTRTQQSAVIACREQPKKNRVSGLIGHGAQSGLNANTSSQPGYATVESNVGVVGGVQYQRKLGDSPFSAGAQLQTNKTGSLLLGIDF